MTPRKVSEVVIVVLGLIVMIGALVYLVGGLLLTGTIQAWPTG